MTAAFMLLFAGVGIVLSRGLHELTSALPLAGLAVGVAMVLIAGRMLAGGTVYLSLGERAADALGSRARTATLRGYFAYGLAYGLVSLSCTLPIFLVVVGSAATLSGLGGALVQFILYGAGMGLVITVLTVSVGLLRHAAARRIRRLLPYFQWLSAGLLLLVGTYLAYYWLTVGGILRSFI
jgi:cytochrome c biogenesis protein CcdA